MIEFHASRVWKFQRFTHKGSWPRKGARGICRSLGEADDAARLRQPGGWDSWTIIALLRGDETAPSNFKCGSLLAAVSYRL